MSQAKVDQHKKDKANRKKEMRMEKLERTAVAVGGIIIVAAICVWIGFSVYNQSNSSAAANAENSSVEVNTDAVDDYLDGLGSTDSGEE